MSESGFNDYWRNTAGRPPRDTVLFALRRIAAEEPARRHAVDLGCGTGRDTLALLRAGFSVTAIDAEAEAIAALLRHPDLPAGARLATRCGRFEEQRWLAADLVVASFSLPLCAPADFSRVWGRVRDSLRPGGRFAGQFLGERDDWASRAGVTCLPRERVQKMLAGLEVEHFAEEECDSVTPRGSAKHWHLFHVVVQTPRE